MPQPHAAKSRTVGDPKREKLSIWTAFLVIQNQLRSRIYPRTPWFFIASDCGSRLIVISRIDILLLYRVCKELTMT